MDLVKKVRYSQCYSFKYSPRPGTPAAIKEQVIECSIITEDALVLLDATFEGTDSGRTVSAPRSPFSVEQTVSGQDLAAAAFELDIVNSCFILLNQRSLNSQTEGRQVAG